MMQLMYWLLRAQAEERRAAIQKSLQSDLDGAQDALGDARKQLKASQVRFPAEYDHVIKLHCIRYMLRFIFQLQVEHISIVENSCVVCMLIIIATLCLSSILNHNVMYYAVFRLLLQHREKLWSQSAALQKVRMARLFVVCMRVQQKLKAAEDRVTAMVTPLEQSVTELQSQVSVSSPSGRVGLLLYHWVQMYIFLFIS